MIPRVAHPFNFVLHIYFINLLCFRCALCVCFNHRQFSLFLRTLGDPSLIRSGWFNSLAGVVKRRFASYVKLHLATGSEASSNGSRERDRGADRFDKHYQVHHRSQSATSATAHMAAGSPHAQLAMSKMAPPSPHVLSGIDRRHRSPDPPPR